jgi:uncharacterized damage-inducible protein DinB
VNTAPSTETVTALSKPGAARAAAFLAHREPLLALLLLVPNEQAEFSAWPGGATFRGILNHLLHSGEGLLAFLQGERSSNAPTLEFAAALARLQANTSALEAKLNTLSNEDLQSSRQAFGGQWLLERLIDFAREHEIHHKGQLWTMARMIGIQPPMFVKF